MVWVIIVLVVLNAIFIIWNISADDKNHRFFSVFLLIISVIILAELVSLYENRNIPTTMDVYEGKTTLEYKVVDGVKVDSVVIFKEEFKKAMEE